MSKVIEREHGVEPDRHTTVEDHELPPLKTIERPAEFTPASTVPEPSKLIRWMGWLVGVLALVGVGVVVWWAAFSSSPAEMTDLEAWHRTEVTRNTASNITNLESWHREEVTRTLAPMTAPSEIDPHESPEVLRALPVGVSVWSLETLELLRSLPAVAFVEIDPHESPEVLRALPVGVSVWSLETLELLRSLPTQGIDELSLESLRLLRSLPVMTQGEIDPHVSPEVLSSRTAVTVPAEIDPHESPEILRIRIP